MPEKKLSKEEMRLQQLQRTGPQALRRMLATPSADVAMEFLDAFYKPDLPAFLIEGDTPLCPLRAAIRDGQRDVINMLRTYHKVQPDEL